MEVPKRSVWISMVTSERTSLTPVRSPRLRRASSRARAGPDLEVHQRELLAHQRADVDDLLGHPEQRLVEREAGLDADHHHVERVGQRLDDGLLARA